MSDVKEVKDLLDKLKSDVKRQEQDEAYSNSPDLTAEQKAKLLDACEEMVVAMSKVSQQEGNATHPTNAVAFVLFSLMHLIFDVHSKDKSMDLAVAILRSCAYEYGIGVGCAQLGPDDLTRGMTQH